MTARTARLLLVFGLALPVGCASVRQPAPAQSGAARDDRSTATPEPELVTSGPHTELDALELDMLVSERRLEAELVRVSTVETGEWQWATPPPGVPPVASAPSTAPTPAPTAAPSAPNAARPAAPAASGELRSEAGSPCDIACRALASMRRSGEGICRLAGEGSERCARARERVVRAGERVAAAGCECTFLP
jgi:hypothetical protein